MQVVAESTEVLRVPISAVLAGDFTDPSQSGARSALTTLVPQGTAPTAFTLSGSWEIDNTVIPNRYWVSFRAPGNLQRGIKYQGYVKLGVVAGDQPILQFPNLIEAV